MTTKAPVVRIALPVAIAALVLVLVPTALAAKGRHGGGGTTGSGSSSLSLAFADPLDTVPNWGDVVTFTVSTTATAYPYVTLTCSVNGAPVYTNTAGFYATYQFTHYFTLSSSSWTSGPASCHADLHSTSGTLATLDFAVYA